MTGNRPANETPARSRTHNRQDTLAISITEQAFYVKGEGPGSPGPPSSSAAQDHCPLYFFSQSSSSCITFNRCSQTTGKCGDPG